MKKSFAIVIPTLLLVLTIAFFIVSSTQAGTLAAVYIFFSRVKADLDGTGAEAVQFVLAIDTATTIPTDGTITIEFPDDEDTTWCRGIGALTVTAVSSSVASLSGTNWEIEAILPNSGTALAAACAQGGVGSVDTITISNVGELAAGTTYGVQVASNTGVIGTNTTAGVHDLTITAASGTTMDSKSFEIDLLTDDAVVISATVSSMPTIDCAISANTVALGTLYPGGAYATGTHTITTSTTSSGYYWAVYGTGDSGTPTNDAGLFKTGGTVAEDLIRSGPTATLDLTSPTVSGFGLTLSDPDTAGAAAVATNFADTTLGTFGTIDRLYAGAKLVLNQSGDQSSPEASTVTYGAKASATNNTGSYQETVYFICGGYY